MSLTYSLNLGSLPLVLESVYSFIFVPSNTPDPAHEGSRYNCVELGRCVFDVGGTQSVGWLEQIGTLWMPNYIKA